MCPYRLGTSAWVGMGVWNEIQSLVGAVREPPLMRARSRTLYPDRRPVDDRA